MVKIIITRIELDDMIKERFGVDVVKWNKEGNALLELDAKEILNPYKEVKEE